MNKLLSLVAVAAVATLTVPLTVAPAAASDQHHDWKRHHEVKRHYESKRHHGWRQVCKTTWDRHHHRRNRVCHRVRW